MGRPFGLALLLLSIGASARHEKKPRMRAFGTEAAARAHSARADASRRALVGLDGADSSRRQLSELNGTDHRTNLCERSRAVMNGSLPVADALAGVTLHFAAALYDDDWIACDAEGSCSGFHVRLMDILAQRAGFEYEISGIPSAEIDDWTVYLYESLSSYDVNLDWWVQNPQRAALGMRCPYEFLDMSIMSSTYIRYKDSTLMDDLLRSFMLPFQPLVWLWLIFITVATAIFYFVLEDGQNPTDMPPEISRLERMTSVIYLGACEMVQGTEGLSPKTGKGKLVVLSFAFFVLLTVSSYTSMLTTR